MAGEVVVLVAEVGMAVGLLGLVLMAARQTRAAVMAGALTLGLGGTVVLLGFAGEAQLGASNETTLTHLRLSGEERAQTREGSATEAHGAVTLGLAAGLSTVTLGALAMASAFARGGRR